MSEKTLARSERAFAAKAKWKPTFDDIYRYILPHRESQQMGGRTEMVPHLFDSTAVYSAVRLAGRFQQEITPPGTVWMEICPGPLYPKDKKDDMVRALEHDNLLMQAVFESGDFVTGSMEMYTDLGAGTGVMFVLEADDDDELIDFAAAPFDECAIDCDAKGRVSFVSWRKEYSAREIYDGWPELRGKMDEKLKKAAKKPSGTKDYKIVQALTHLPAEKRGRKWRYELIIEGSKDKGKVTGTALRTAYSATCPAVVPRYAKLPGESIGFGPIMWILPSVRTANKTVEMILQAAAIALFGMFTVTDDGILNPDKARIEPGGMLMVESNASGNFGGRSVEQLNLPQNFNVSDLVLQDQRAQIKNGLMDDQLPPEAGAVRSPTEIIARRQNQTQDINMASGRLVSEYLVPLVQRVHEILSKQNLVTPDIRIDQKMIMVKSVGPISKAQNLEKLQSIVQALELAMGVGGQEMVALAFEIEEIVIEIGRLMGMPPSFVRAKLEREELLSMVANIVAQSQQNAEAQGQPGPVEQAVGGA